MISYWGVDHGDVVSKADDKYGGNGAPTAGRRATAYLATGWHGAIAGKKGKKLRSAGTQIGAGLAGGYGGQAAGLGVSALSRGKIKPKVATGVGGVGGAITGSTLSTNRLQRKGYLKPQEKGAF